MVQKTTGKGSRRGKRAGAKSAGARLAVARRRARLQIEDVAEQLNLTAATVKALEAEDYEALPGPTFARGYTHTYARFMGIDPVTLAPPAETPAVATGVPARPHPTTIGAAHKTGAGSVVLASMVIAGLVGTGLWWGVHGNDYETEAGIGWLDRLGFGGEEDERRPLDRAPADPPLDVTRVAGLQVVPLPMGASSPASAEDGSGSGNWIIPSAARASGVDDGAAEAGAAMTGPGAGEASDAPATPPGARARGAAGDTGASDPGSTPPDVSVRLAAATGPTSSSGGESSAAAGRPAAVANVAPTPAGAGDPAEAGQDPSTPGAGGETMTGIAQVSVETATVLARAASDTDSRRSGTGRAGAEPASGRDPVAARAEDGRGGGASPLDRLTLRASAQSWIEVVDADRKRLLFTMLESGDERRIVGRGPFKLVVGYAPGVELTINDRSFDFLEFERDDHTARFEVAGR